MDDEEEEMDVYYFVVYFEKFRVLLLTIHDDFERSGRNLSGSTLRQLKSYR